MEAPEDRSVRGRRRGAQWVRVSHGLYRPADAEDAFRSELQAWRRVLPEGAAFTHLTGARARGWWLPPLPDDVPVFASAPRGTIPQRPGLRVIRPKSLGEVEGRDGVPLAPAAETLLACARDLGLLDLVVLVSSALHQGEVTPADLERVAAGRAWGAGRLREAIALADERLESAWEAVLLVLHVVCEIPVVPQYELVDDNGGFIARGDLWLVGTRRFHEYDGGEHRTRDRQRKDLRRDGRIGDTDWERRGCTREDVLHQALRILRDADNATGREHRPERIRAWYALLRESLFTPAGTAAVLRRWGMESAAG